MKKLLPLMAVTTGLLFSACNTPQVEVKPVPVLNITGTATVAASQSLTLMGSDGQPVGTSVSVGADGAFNAALPTPEASRLKSVTTALADLPCTVSTPLTSSDAAAVGMGVSSAKTGNTIILPATVSKGLISRHVELHAWIYSDRATTLTGSLDCAKATGGAISTVPVTVKASLAAGWTPVMVTLDASIGIGGVSGSGSIATANDYTGAWISMIDIQNQLKP